MAQRAPSIWKGVQAEDMETGGVRLHMSATSITSRDLKRQLDREYPRGEYAVLVRYSCSKMENYV